jgi:hypothetical protein
MTNELDWLRAHESHLVASLSANAQSEQLRRYFSSRTRRWKHYLVSGESGTSTIFGDLSVTTSQAFDLIPTATALALEQVEADLFTLAIGLLFDLAVRSETTEMPPALAQQWALLTQKITELPDDGQRLFLWNELNRWYRKHDTFEAPESVL